VNLHHCNDGIRMHVINMIFGYIGVQRCIDGRGARVKIECAVGKVADHFVLMLGSAVDAFK